MNMIDVQDKLKGLSQQQLIAEMQSPSGVAPQFLVLSEITRRKRMQDSYQNQQQQPNTTIAEEAVASAGVPVSGLAAMARSMAPNSSMAQNTAAMPQPLPQEQPVQGMYGGGYVQKMAGGMSVSGQPADMSNPMVSAWVRREAQRRGVPVEEVLANLGPTGAAISAAAPSMDARNRMLGLEPVGTSNLNFPTQADLDQRYADTQRGDTFIMPSQEELDLRARERNQREAIFPNSGFTPDPPEIMGFGRPDPSQPPQARPPFTMDYRSQAIDRATARGGREGILDALLASGTPMVNAGMLLPDIDCMREAQRQQRIKDQGRYYPGTGAATELNLPAFRQPSGGAGLATGLKQMAEDYPMRQQALIAQGDRVGFDSSYRYPDVPVDDMTAMLSQAGPEFERSGRETVDLDLTAPTMFPPAPPTADEILDQKEYGFEPGSDRRMTAAEILSQSSGPSAPLPVRPEGGGMLPSGKTRDEYSQPGEYGNPDAWYSSILQDIADTAAVVSPFSSEKDANEALASLGAMNYGDGLTTADAISATKEATKALSKNSDASGGGGKTPDASGNGTPASGESVTGRGSGAAVGGSNVPTSYEQELRDAMVRAEKRANQDKWMALAQVGMQLMASKEPTLGGALGEAGIAGLQAYRGSRDGYEAERLGLSKSLHDLQQQQAAALAAQRAAAAKATGKPLTPEQQMKQIEDRLKFLVKDDGFGGEVIMPGADGAVAALRQKYTDLLNGGSSGTFDATAQ